MIYVIASIKLKPGVREKFLEIFKANVPNVLAEEGCLSYDPCVDVTSDMIETDPNLVTIVEEWESLEHLKDHLAAPHMKKYAADVADLRLSTSLKIVENA